MKKGLTKMVRNIIVNYNRKKAPGQGAVSSYSMLPAMSKDIG